MRALYVFAVYGLTTQTPFALATNNADAEEATQFCVDYKGSDYLSTVTNTVNNTQLNDAVSNGMSFAQSQLDRTWAMAGMFSNRENLLIDELKKTEDKFSNTFFETYVKGLVPYAAPGIVLCCLSLLCCPLCFCCCKRMCFKKRETEEYNILQKLLPLGFYILFSTIAVALSFVSISQMGNFVSGTVTSLCDVNTFGLDFQSFLSNIVPPVNNLENKTLGLIDTVKDVFDKTDAIDSSYNRVLLSLDNFSNYLTDIQSGNISSSSIDDIANQVSKAMSEVKSQAGPIISSMKTTKTDINRDLENNRNAVHDAAEIARKVLTDSSITDGMFKFTHDATKGAGQYLPMLSNFSYFFFSTVFIAFAAGIIVIVSVLTPCKMDDKIAKWSLRGSFVCSYFFMMFLFLLAGVFMPVTLLFSDTCEVLDEVPTDFKAYFGAFMDKQSGEDFDLVAVVEGCFAVPSVSMIEAFNLTQQFQFLETAFQDLDAATANLDSNLFFGDMDMMASSARNLSLADFNVAKNVAESLKELNDYLSSVSGGTATTYTESDCTTDKDCNFDCLATTTCAPQADNPTANKDNLDGLRLQAMSSIAATNVIRDVNGHVDVISSHTDELSINIRFFSGNVTKIEDRVDVVGVSVDDVIASGNCTFVATSYWKIQTSLCQDTFTPLGSLSLLFLLIAMCGIVVVITSIFINVRLFGTNRPAAVWADKVR